MTRLWGPLGWMTLHSVSLCYPVNPSAQDKAQAKRFLDLFAATISCYSCKSHFIRMYDIYRTRRPNFLDSRQNFAVFTFEAHNTVNKRIDKPVFRTVQDCINTLETARTQTSFAGFRVAYLNYLIRNWSNERSGDALIALGQAREMINQNNSYWTPMEPTGPIVLHETDLQLIESETMKFSMGGVAFPKFVGFRNGKLQLARR